jgi:hypothetical protein
MPRLLNYLAPLYVWLYALDPMLPQALFVSLVFFTVWLLRKLAPNQWEGFANLIHVKSDDTSWWQNELRAAWQMLPAAIIGTLYGVLGTGGELWPTLKATLLSLLAPVVHRIAKRYEGKTGKPKDPEGPRSRKSVGLAGGALMFALLLLTGCAFWKDAKPVLRDTNDIARSLCAQFFGEKQGISVVDAAKKFCETRDDFAPWIDSALAAKQAGGKAALARKPAAK